MNWIQRVNSVLGRRCTAAALAACALLGAAGCQRDVTIDRNNAVLQPLKDDVQVYLRVNPATGKVEDFWAIKPEDNGELTPHSNLLDPSSDLAAHPKPAPADDPLSSHGPQQDYVDKCDAYWKLNAVRKSLLNGIVPQHMMTGLQDMKQRLQRCIPDGNFELAISAINHMERGLIHLEADQAIQSAGVDVQLAPWSQGSSAISHFVDREILGHRMPHAAFSDSDSSDTTEDSADSSSTPAQVDMPASPTKLAVADLMKQYATSYTRSPQIMMGQEFQKAIEETNRLRDNLHLANRPENSDGDRSDVDPSISRAGINMPAGSVDVLEIKRLVDQMVARNTLGIENPIP